MFTRLAFPPPLPSPPLSSIPAFNLLLLIGCNSAKPAEPGTVGGYWEMKEEINTFKPKEHERGRWRGVLL